MITISLCMIVKNEEETLERCLKSACGIADEIIIADTGSTDRTKEIALKYTDKVYDFEWVDDFSAARNFSYSHATMDYILWLDADDVILPADAEKLARLKESLPEHIGAVMMKYNTGFDEKGRVTFSYYRERLSRRDGHSIWREPVHEYLDVAGNRINSDICITHAKPSERHGEASDGRNIRIYERYISAGRELSPRGMYYYARELKDAGRYGEAAEWYRTFLDTGKGWIEDVICACGDTARCLLAEGKPQEALYAMLESFAFDTPRAEICCQLGYYFKERACYKQAAFWFEIILSLKRNENNWGFVREDCWGYIPCVELAVCYDKLGEFDKASEFNDRAAEIKPYSPSVLRNKAYFSRILGKAE